MTTMPYVPRLFGWPVKLPINIAVVYEGKESVSHLSAVSPALAQAVQFYEAQHIILQPAVQGLALGQHAYEELTSPSPWEPFHTHAFRLGGKPLTVVYLSFESHWKQQLHLGESFGGHLALVAGNHSLAGPTLIHEIGHLLLNDPPTGEDHQPGTFMDGTIWQFSPSAVSTAQRTRLYESAYRLGSL